MRDIFKGMEIKVVNGVEFVTMPYNPHKSSKEQYKLANDFYIYKKKLKELHVE